MTLQVYTNVDELEIAAAILKGDLRLEHILQYVFKDDHATNRLIAEIEHEGGTHIAGLRTARFSLAMEET